MSYAMSMHAGAAMQGAAAWPEIRLSAGMWSEYARAAAAARSPSEVYIAFAITARAPGAIAAFEATYFCVIERALERLGATATEMAAIKDRLRQRLFERGGEPPLVVAIAGHGQLRRELRRHVLRLFIETRRERQERVLVDETAALLPAIDALPENARTALRLCVLHQLPVAEIARRMHVDDATVVRKLTRARLSIAPTITDELAGDLIAVLVDMSLDGGAAAG